MFKYQQQIDALIDLGAKMPPLFSPNGILAYRYIFANNERGINHIPPFIISPARAIVKENRNVPPVEGYALSCYTDDNKATEVYYSFINERPLLRKALGDTLCCGIISNDLGMVTTPNKVTHFELFEYVGCNLNDIFTKTEKKLI